LKTLKRAGQVPWITPGTGKTHLTVRLAAALADGDGDRVSVVQFHPATTYEDFFEGLRPAVTPAGQVTYQRTSGPLVTIAEKADKHEAEDRTFVLVIDEINRANLPKVSASCCTCWKTATSPSRPCTGLPSRSACRPT
jgi:5-methylcytosine-specific restriction protein B